MSSRAVLLFRMMSCTLNTASDRAGQSGQENGDAVQPERLPPELLADVQSGCAEQGKTGEKCQLFVKHKFCEKLK